MVDRHLGLVTTDGRIRARRYWCIGKYGPSGRNVKNGPDLISLITVLKKPAQVLVLESVIREGGKIEIVLKAEI